jgi:hypothetical protein
VKKRIIIPIIVVALKLSACTTPNYRESRSYDLITPIMDTTMNPKDRNLDKDLKECNWYANGIAGPGQNAMNNGVAGALGGAAVGAIVGAAFGVNPGPTAAIGAASGGIGGAARGAISSSLARKQVVSNCMRGRGYSVLN